MLLPGAPNENAGKILPLDCCPCLLLSFPAPNPKRFVELPLLELPPFKKGFLSLTKVFSVFPSLFDENNDCWLIALDTWVFWSNNPPFSLLICLPKIFLELSPLNNEFEIESSLLIFKLVEEEAKKSSCFFSFCKFITSFFSSIFTLGTVTLSNIEVFLLLNFSLGSFFSLTIFALFPLVLPNKEGVGLFSAGWFKLNNPPIFSFF